MPPPPDATDAETPDDAVAVLRDLEIEPTGDLPARVRRSIGRRYLGRDLIGFYWTGMASLMREWLSALLEQLLGRPPTRKEQR